MDAHYARLLALVAAAASLGASHRTPNFVVTAPTPQMAEQIGQTAEKYRRELAVEWLGKEMPNWGQPCPVTAQVGDHLGAGGATSFVFDHGEVFSWRMTIQGSLERILDSVLPHEVTHTIFATHFRRPLPRWADEGACTTVEHDSEKSKQQVMLVNFLHTGRGIAFNRMFAMKEYPHDVMPLYSQGYSVARYLVAQGGKRRFLEYLADGMADENWNRATQKYYGVNSLAELQKTWLDWVRQGSPAITAPGDSPTLLAVQPRPATDRNSRADAAQLARGAEDTARRGDRLAAVTGPTTRSVYELAAEDKAAFSATVEDEAWHAPRRPSPQADRTANELALGPKEESPAQTGTSAAHQATRPQPIERARQVILEWSRPLPAAEQPAPSEAAQASRSLSSIN